MAALGLVLAAVPAHAASYFETATTKAEFSGRNVAGRFLVGSFIVAPEGWSDGSADKASGGSPSIASVIDPLSGGDGTAVDQAPDVLMRNDVGRSSGGSASGTPESGSWGTLLGSVGGITGSGVSTVPLPAALPCFGFAVLLLAALGLSGRRRAGSSMP